MRECVKEESNCFRTFGSSFSDVQQSLDWCVALPKKPSSKWLMTIHVVVKTRECVVMKTWMCVGSDQDMKVFGMHFGY